MACLLRVGGCGGGTGAAGTKVRPLHIRPAAAAGPVVACYNKRLLAPM